MGVHFKKEIYDFGFSHGSTNTQNNTLKMAGDQQQFCLRWNDFQTNMVSSFKHLRDEKSFADVTPPATDRPARPTRWSCPPARPTSKPCWRRTPPNTQSSSSRTSLSTTSQLFSSLCMQEKSM